MFEKLKINTKLLKELDISIIMIACIIVIFGAVNIYSATFRIYGIYYLKLQLVWLVLGLVIMYLILVFDYSVIMNYANVIYWASILLLVINDTLGKVSKGARSWIALGNRAIQPSEFAKLALIIMLAKKLDEMEGSINKPKNFFTLCFYALLPMAFIVVQPDMGMTMVCFFIVLGIFFLSGLNLKVIVGGFVSIIITVVVMWNTSFMEGYWKTRLVSFINPNTNNLGSNMQLQESLKSIGSGGILGKGFMKGTQVAGGFIPEVHNDFIFAVVGEEWGLIGALFLLMMYTVLISRFIRIARSSKDIFGSVICFGVISTFLFLILQNIGMTIGIMPVTGVTLPLMSYGGSSILTSFISIGIVLNIGMRRKKINF